VKPTRSPEIVTEAVFDQSTILGVDGPAWQEMSLSPLPLVIVAYPETVIVKPDVF
jgi:hypothetical protein